MSTIYGVTAIPRTNLATRILGSFEWCRAAALEWRQRERLKTGLHQLSDAELIDIGISRGEIDYVAMNRCIDPRGACFSGDSDM